jgi:ribosomal protein S18 acetylase RimI-like enzyme
VSGLVVRPIDDPEAVAKLIDRAGNGAFLVIRGIVYEAHALRAVVAERDGEVVGYAPYSLAGHIAFVCVMSNFFEDEEVTRALIGAVEALCRRAGRGFLRAVTSNDAIELLGLLQQLGYRIVAIWPNAMDLVRELKPRLPAIAANGVPIRDEIELEIAL